MLAKQFLGEYGVLLGRIDDAERMSVELESACRVLSHSVSDADNNMRAFMHKSAELESRQGAYLEQSKEIDAFLKKFSLSTEEIDVLQNAKIDHAVQAKNFFAALSHLCQAYKDCKSMVSSNNYNAGFELLDVLGRHQDAAFERLFEWVKVKCESTPENTSSEDVDLKLTASIKYLRELPAYFSQCQDLVTNSRRAQVVQRFIQALTQGGASNYMSGAIDLHAHDAVRYVSDMLAWMHQTIVSEEEFLRQVFGDSPTEKGDLGEDAPPAGLSVQELLSRCLQGLGRPLRMRVLQSLEGRVSVSALFSLHDLLTFYEGTFARLLRSENAVHSAVKGSLLECKRTLAQALNRQTEALLEAPTAYPVDLSAVDATLHCARQIQELLRVHDTALCPSSDELDQCSIINVLGGVVQPLLQACRVSGHALEGTDLAIFMLNNVAVVQVCGLFNIAYVLVITQRVYSLARVH
jgi:hypothetical protein